MNADDLRRYDQQITNLQEDILGREEEINQFFLSPESDAHLQIALAHLEQAKQHVRLATYAVMQKR